MTNDLELTHVRQASDRFFHWLTNQALPLWSATGVDWELGGFVEQLTPAGEPIADVRRARLVARQIFAFKSAGKLGWDGPVDRLVEHGLAALLQRHLTEANRIVPRYFPREGRGEGAFDLYDHAFVLFGLAHGFGHTGDERLEATAVSILLGMRDGWTVEGGGFAEHRPAQAPLKANPHMHLLEASLAWMDISSGPAWRALAAEIVELCLSRFVSPNGALHEYFETDWSILTGDQDVIEPGHQVEWAWLLGRWEAIQPTDGLEQAARRLFDIAEGEGLNRDQHRLINELNEDLSPRDTRLRLWPQTERIKALVAFYERDEDPLRRKGLARHLAQAIEALLGYFEHPIRGSWWEHFDEDDKPVPEPARASSLYHIMGAANELARLTGARLG